MPQSDLWAEAVSSEYSEVMWCYVASDHIASKGKVHHQQRNCLKCNINKEACANILTLCKQFKPYHSEDNDIMLYKMLWKGVVELIFIWVLEGNQNAQWKSSVLLLNTIVTRSGASRNHLMKGLHYCELNWKRMILKPCAVINPIHKASEIHGMWQTGIQDFVLLSINEVFLTIMIIHLEANTPSPFSNIMNSGLERTVISVLNFC